MRRLCAKAVRGCCLFFIMLVLTTAGTACEASGLVREDITLSSEKTEFAESPPEDLVSEEIYVHVCGCVKKPGLYTLSSGARIADAVDLAGGFTKEADRNARNLAALADDGMQIYIPSREESAASGEKDQLSSNGSGTGLPETAGTDAGAAKININTAQEQELMTLNGIGASRARDIIAYREANGAFARIEDIKNVSGIGDSIFEKIKEQITVS